MKISLKWIRWRVSHVQSFGPFLPKIDCILKTKNYFKLSFFLFTATFINFYAKILALSSTTFIWIKFHVQVHRNYSIKRLWNGEIKTEMIKSLKCQRTFYKLQVYNSIAVTNCSYLTFKSSLVQHWLFEKIYETIL